MDLTEFFNPVNHDVLMARIAQMIRDKWGGRLIGRYLGAAAMVTGVVQANESGPP